MTTSSVRKWLRIIRITTLGRSISIGSVLIAFMTYAVCAKACPVPEDLSTGMVYQEQVVEFLPNFPVPNEEVSIVLRDRDAILQSVDVGQNMHNVLKP